MIQKVLSAPLHLYYDRKITERIFNVFIRELPFTDLNLSMDFIKLISIGIEFPIYIILIILSMFWSVAIFIFFIPILVYFYIQFLLKFRKLKIYKQE